MIQPFSPTRLHSLVDAMIDGAIDAQSLGELNERLERDPEFRRQYMNFMCIEAEMRAMHAGGDAVRPADLSATSTTAAPVAAARDRSWSGRVLAIAASLLAVACGSAWVTYNLVGGNAAIRAAAAGDDARPAGDAVARITGTRDCRWTTAKGDTSYGATLYAGQVLKLERGLAEITFDAGARVVIEGPSTFRVPGGESGELVAGRIAAAVPRGAVGFTIRTPRLTISDSGTQYGLVATADGATEVHVFEGPVMARALDDHGQPQAEVQLTATEAARLTPVSTSFAMFRADGDRFVRTLTPSAGPTDGLLAFEDFDYPVGPLAWQNGGFGWAGPWADLEAPDDAASQEGALSNGVAEGSLSGCELISRGNRAALTAQQNRIRRNLSTSLRGVFDAASLIEIQDGVRLIGHEGATVYLSFLQRVSFTGDVFYGFELHRGDGNANRVLSIGAGVEETGYGATSNYNSPFVADSFVPLGEEDTEAHLFVVRIDFRANNDDRVTVFRDPDSLIDERQCKSVATLRGNFAFDRISLGNFNGVRNKTHEVDEIRVGTSFTAVTGQRTSSTSQLASRNSEDHPGSFNVQTKLSTIPHQVTMLLNSALK